MINTNYLINGIDIAQQYLSKVEYITDYNKIKPELKYTTWHYQGNADPANGIPNSLSFPLKHPHTNRNIKKCAQYPAAAGTGYGIILTASGTIMMWGDNTYGQLGQGNTTNSPVPIRVGLVDEWADFTITGFNNTTVMAIKKDGTLWGWGRNRDNSTPPESSYTYLWDYNVVEDVVAPIQLGSNRHFIKFCENFRGAIDANGSVWFGRQNNFNVVSYRIPTALPITAISGHNNRNRALAITTEHQLYDVDMITGEMLPVLSDHTIGWKDVAGLGNFIAASPNYTAVALDNDGNLAALNSANFSNVQWNTSRRLINFSTAVVNSNLSTPNIINAICENQDWIQVNLTSNGATLPPTVTYSIPDSVSYQPKVVNIINGGTFNIITDEMDENE